MRIGVLTSSRADYSIYYPLLKKIQSDDFFQLSIIAFGTHLSEKHGYTLQKIKEDGFEIYQTVASFPEGDSPASITTSMGKTMEAFAKVWTASDFDLVLCLGDRYEMFAACASAVPFNIRLAHIHGGEETLGAIDNAFRHSITHMAIMHFTAAEPYRQRVITLKGSDENVYNTGSLSIDNLSGLQLLSKDEFNFKFGIDLSKPTILITFHPETVSFHDNEQHVTELVAALNEIEGYQFVITMPNADTMGSLVRKKLNDFIQMKQQAIGVESFGTLGYLTCMKYCSFMLGNTSSGYIEAAYFPKYVIDLGDRQSGRIVTANINRCKIKKQDILDAVDAYTSFQLPEAVDIYGNGNTANSIIKILKQTHD
jgi:GDP/UDP-N,N'-diacetylbacillosamine 2-epimerase (hydrolysing)